MVSDWFRRIYPPRTLAIAAVIAIIVWLAGPMGTFDVMHPVLRFFYWSGLIIGAVVPGCPLRMMVNRRWKDLTAPMKVLMMATLFSIAYTPVVYGATYLATSYGLAEMETLWTLWAGTFLASASVYAVQALVVENDQMSAARSALAAAPEQPRLLQRIEANLHGPLVSISVRDHYVDVRTEAGKASLLMRLSDAIAETEGVDGAQVHRSHWVNWHAVKGVDRHGGNLVLRMADGAPIPVSRNHREKLEERGLI